ncbi:hypothetical protein AgCh_025240 [Apium graveolens]
MKDYTPEDISSIMKDAKVRHILHNSLDSVMSNIVIGCKTVKEIWDALEVKYQGTTVIKKNRRTVLTQEYEHFDSRDNESLTEIYGRFQKLPNDLSLVNKEYDLEDSNLKFLLALPEKSKRKGSKARPVALNVEEKPKEKARRNIYSKGKAMIAKLDTKSSNSDDDSNPNIESDTDSDQNNNEDIDQMVALLFKRKDTDWKEARSGKPDKLKERCYNCDRIGHFAADCRKSKAEKKQALILKKRNWDDSSDSDDGINYALMVNANVETDLGKTTQEILENVCWGSGLGYSARSNSDKKSGEETEKT